MSRMKKVMAAGLLCGLMLAGTTGASAAPAQGDAAGQRVNLNTASAEELVRLPGIGPSLAQAIIKYRAQEPFAKAEDVRKVKGIGDKLYERIKDQLTVGDPAPSPKGRGG
jgi:competence protein ComEA